MSSNFTAAPQALGYIYQLRYALYRLLSETEGAAISIEKLDDIAIEKGDPYQVLQLKRLKKTTAVTNRSPELWKTIRVWCELIKTNQVKLPDIKFVLVTTSEVQEGTIAYLLRSNNRDAETAYQRMMAEASSNQNKALKNEPLKKSFEEFLLLDDTERKNLVQNIEILDAALDIFDIPVEVQSRFFTSVRREFRPALYERLEGWWFDKMVNHLGGLTSDKVIPRFEIEDEIADLAEQFQPGALPIDFFDKSPEIPDDAGERVFVVQLREIEVSSERIEKAIKDYYKAVAQRSRWAREDLLFGDELKTFDDRLVDEWERFSAAFTEEVEDDQDENELKKCGRKILNHMEFDTDYLRIREKVSEPYVKRGSYHMLADMINGNPRVWWHPLFLQKIKNIISPGD